MRKLPIPSIKRFLWQDRTLHVIFTASIVLCLLLSFFFYLATRSLETKVQTASEKEKTLQQQLQTITKELQTIKSENQFVINQKNTKEITDIQNTYKKTITAYEKLNDLKLVSKTTTKQDQLLALALKQLAERNYASAEATLTTLTKQIDEEKAKLATTTNVENLPEQNAPPGSGYRRQAVKTEIGTYAIDIVAGDLASTRVIVDTASDSDCRDNCPVIALGDYVTRNSAYAGINGSYFCPASYPSCAGKTNSFDTLLMNKNKTYFNADNNLYSTVPAVIFQGNTVRFVSRSLDWGRDTSIDSMIANQPLLLLNGQNLFGGDGDPKKGSKGTRSFVGSKGNTVYIGVVHNVTVAEMAIVLKTLGLDNALNLDSGGSTALWYSGYKAGPGRAIPNAILFLRR